MSFFSSASRSGLRSLVQPTILLSLAPVRAQSTRATTVAAVAATTRSNMMSTSALVAAGTIAAGAYVLYMRSNAAEAATPGGKPPFASFPSWNTLTLASTESVNDNVKKLVFELPDPKTPSGLTPTSALLAFTHPGGSWLPTPRPYTPVNDLDDPGHIDFLVKLYPDGKGSGFLHGLKPGDTVTFMRIPGYSWKANEQSHIALVAGGQGITPCYQLLRAILRNPADKTRITLVWGVNRDSDLWLRQELADLEKQYPGRLTTIFTVSHPAPGSEHQPGRVTAELLQKAGIVPGGVSGVGKVFVSGPPAMESALTDRGGIFTKLGFGKKEVHKF